MFFEFFSRLVSLDVPWIVSLAMNNLALLFMLGAFVYFMNNGNKWLLAFALVVSEIWLWSDFELAANAVVFSGGFLAVYYVSKFALVAFVESSPALEKKLLPIFLLHGWIVLFAFNLL